MTPRNYEIVDCGAFCEVIFFCISPKNLPGDFFDSLSCNCDFLISSFRTSFQVVILVEVPLQSSLRISSCNPIGDRNKKGHTLKRSLPFYKKRE